jgi:hypothetical protein
MGVNFFVSTQLLTWAVAFRPLAFEMLTHWFNNSLLFSLKCSEASHWIAKAGPERNPAPANKWTLLQETDATIRKEREPLPQPLATRDHLSLLKLILLNLHGQTKDVNE